MTRLSLEERIEIKALLNANISKPKIAAQLGRSKMTIYREIERNSVDGVYEPNLANKMTKSRKKVCGKAKITEENWTVVRSLLKLQWSPEQIDGFLKANPAFGFRVGRERIYKYIHDDRSNGGSLYMNLRRGGKPYKNKKEYRGKIKDRVSIEARPDIVDKRLRIGDWEVDSVIGRLHQSSIVTLVERSSRYVMIIKVNSKEADQVSQAIISRVKESDSMKFHTITGDNGTEFADHKSISESLNIDFYFTNPYSSWEKGTNENTNGLIRQYLPKGTDFNKISDTYIKEVEDKLNSRPRKCLKFKTPYEVVKNGSNKSIVS